MDKTEALKALGLDENASTEDIQASLKSKKQDIAEKKAAAPTDALKAKFESLEAKLAEVEQALADATSRSLPLREPADATASPQQKQHSTGQSSLSHTKLADLPGLAPQDAAQVELQPGQILANRYKIKELIGQGGMGAVYRAFDKNRDEDIAIKVLLPSLTKNERALERFLNEARVSSKLSHQHIVNVYDVQSAPQIDGSGDLYFLIMELLEGQDLAQLIQTREQLNQPFTAKELTEVIEQLSPALDYAHQHTVHRDIKPENIWLDEDGQYKLMDFGIAQLQSTSQRTQTGAAMGTAYYMAPEQLKGSKNVDARADIYALGVMLYAMATGDVPAGLIKPPHEKRTDISPAFSAAVMQCLEADPEDRPQCAGELLFLLQKGLTGKGGKTRKSKTVKPSRPASAANLHGGGPNKLAIAAVLLLLVGFGGAVGTGVVDLSGLMPMSAAEKAEKEAAIARIQGEIKVLKQRLEAGRRNLDSDLRDAERNNSNNLKALQHWQTLTENSLFNGSKIGELEGTLSMAETLLRKEQFTQSHTAFTQVKAGYEKLNEAFRAGQKLYAADQAAQKAKSDWQAYKKKYGFTGKSASAEQAQQSYDEAQQNRRSGELAASLPLYEQASASWNAAKQAPDVAALVKEKEAGWEAAAEKERKEAAAKKARIAKLVGKLVKIPGGSFSMGSNEGGSNEKPVQRVSVKSFYMQEHEVTWNQYQPCIDAGICVNTSSEGWGKGNRPVIHLSWNDIQTYIKWLNRQTGQSFRLPSEAEWEYAARAGSTSKYSWGDSVGSNRANCDGCGSQWDDSKTAPVKSFSPNRFGLYDMHGNVWEWVQDCWNNTYSGAPGNGSAWSRGDCSKRVLRGGSWYNLPDSVRSAVRHRITASGRLSTLGFRLVQER